MTHTIPLAKMRPRKAKFFWDTSTWKVDYVWYHPSAPQMVIRNEVISFHDPTPMTPQEAAQRARAIIIDGYRPRLCKEEP